MAKKPNIGGQAVIEGVMMKSDSNLAIAVRTEKGKIMVRRERLKEKNKIWRIPFFRGVFNLVEIIIIGMKALIWSSNQVLEEEDKKQKKKTKEKSKTEFSVVEIALLIIFSFGFAMLFFVALPYFLTFLIGYQEETKPFLFNIIDGLIKVIIFFLYIYAISFLKDIRRTFEYHGAEHMAVHCYEDKKALTIENVRKYKTLHPRCGTAFLMIVLTVAIFMLSIIPPIVIWLYPGLLDLGFWTRRLILFPIRILFFIPIASISYELLKLGAKHEKNVFSRALVWPGLMFQKMTTKNPDKKQIEVAIVALKGVLEKEKPIS